MEKTVKFTYCDICGKDCNEVFLKDENGNLSKGFGKMLLTLDVENKDGSGKKVHIKNPVNDLCIRCHKKIVDLINKEKENVDGD